MKHRAPAPALIAAILLCLTVLAIRPASAQQTRAEEIAARQAEKAGDLRPFEPTALERYIGLGERLVVDPPPFYAYIGSIMPGGLLSLGPGYRERVGGTAAVFDAHAGWSLRNYKLIETSLAVPLAEGLLSIHGDFSWMDAPGVGFWGLGMDTSESDRTQYQYRTTMTGATVRVRPLRFVSVGGRVHYLDTDTDARDLLPALRQRVPGPSADPNYVVSGASAEFDWRGSPGYSRRGGLYRIDWAHHDQRDGNAYSFDRVDGEVVELIPVLRANWVVGLRAMASITDVADGNVVPFFMLPDLGGGRNLRGYSPWRFRDEHRILVSGEYRWTAGQFVDMALFLDAGKVTARRADLNLKDLKTSFGIGVRFHTPLSTPLRIEFARTDDGPALVFAFGPSF